MTMRAVSLYARTWWKVRYENEVTVTDFLFQGQISIFKIFYFTLSTLYNGKQCLCPTIITMCTKQHNERETYESTKTELLIYIQFTK